MEYAAAVLPGFVLGSITVLIIWGVAALVQGSARRRIIAGKEELISTIEKKWTEVDSLVTSLASGRITRLVFRNSLEEKLETINRLYKPQIHRLDIFFVKYNEKLLEEYGRMLVTDAPPSRISEYETEPDRDKTLVQEPVEERDLHAPPSEEETGVASMLEQEPEREAEEVAATVSDEAPSLEAEAEPSEEFQEEAAAVEEEPVVASMSEAAQTDDAMPIETFLEMEPSTGIIEEQIDVPVPDSIEETAERPLEQEPAPAPEQEPAPEPEPALSQEIEPAAETAVPEYAGPEMAEEEPDEVVFDSGETPQVLDEPEDTMQEVSPEYAEETMIDLPLPGSVPPPAPEPATVLPPPPSFVPPPHPARPPDYKRDETVEPATILDIEAETIIADRNEILGKKKPPPREEPAKGTLGITGDDISDQLDNFFNIK